MTDERKSVRFKKTAVAIPEPAACFRGFCAVYFSETRGEEYAIIALTLDALEVVWRDQPRAPAFDRAMVRAVLIFKEPEEKRE